MHICSCGEDEWPDLQFQIDEATYTIPRETYVQKDFHPVWMETVCVVQIMAVENLDFYLLGLNFFENYYTVFDKENRRVGFTLSKTAVPRLAEIVAADKEESTSLFSVHKIDKNWQ